MEQCATDAATPMGEEVTIPINQEEKEEKKLGLIHEPAETYHAVKALSSHAIIEMVTKSPLHYYSNYVLGEKKKESDALRFGSAFHSAILEPDKYSKLMCCEPEVNRRTNAGKAELKEWHENLSLDALVVKPEEKEQIEDMIDSLHSHPVASELLKGGVPEISGYFMRDGIYCKVRPDYIHKDKKVLIDLKSTRDASFKAFQRDIFNYGYYIQTGWYFDSYEYLLGQPAEEYVYVAIEKTIPYVTAVYVADATVIERGQMECRKGMKIYNECMKLGKWPGYQTEAQNISLPYWALYYDE